MALKAHVLMAVALVAAHVARIAAGDASAEAALAAFGFAPSLAHGGATLFMTLASYPFLHVGWWHLALNVLGLLIFGQALARGVGGARFILLFMWGCAFGALTHWATQGGMSSLIGASAGVSALVGAWLRLAARKPQGLFAVGCVWMVLNFALGAWPGGADGLSAWQAHLGGFLFGLYAAPFFATITRPRDAGMSHRR